MLTVDAFCGIRYNIEKIDNFSSVLAPPYDVINPKLQNQLYEINPYNVIRLILSMETGEERYKISAETLLDWKECRILIQDKEPCIYPYYQEFNFEGKTLTRKGFIAVVKLEDLSTGKILPHEKTFSKPKIDRLKLT